MREDNTKPESGNYQHLSAEREKNQQRKNHDGQLYKPTDNGSHIPYFPSCYSKSVPLNFHTLPSKFRNESKICH